jgi:hypothetical protein
MNRTLILALAAASLGALAIFGSIHSADAAAPNTYVKLQASSPGSAQTGNTNVAGAGIFGAGLLAKNGGTGVFPFIDLAGVRGEGVGLVTAGVLGISDNYIGLVGYTSAGIAGTFGRNDGPNGIGVYGWATGTTSDGVVGVGTRYGVNGSAPVGVVGTGGTYGVQGIPSSASAFGVFAQNGLYSGDFWNSTTSNGTGAVCQADVGAGSKGVWGYAAAGSGGYFFGDYGVQSTGRIAGYFSSSGAYGVYGYSSSAGSGGVWGEQTNTSSSGWGLVGYGPTDGVYGASNGTTSRAGVYGQSSVGAGVYGSHTGTSGASTSAGVYGISSAGSGNGVAGRVTGTGAAYAIWGLGNGGTTYAGVFSGNVSISGSISKGSGTFKIDHPMDPEHKYLYHSFVESPDMMNVYNGNVRTDASGYADVALPTYFEALNKDFRYQLTVLDDSDDFVMAKVTRKVEGNSFTIRTSKPNVEVSWQVTGIRKDPYANAHRVVPEVDKVGQDVGKYLHPLEWGQPASKGVEYKRIQELINATSNQSAPQPGAVRAAPMDTTPPNVSAKHSAPGAIAATKRAPKGSVLDIKTR